MTIRNQNNDRYKDGGKKNVARTSPGRAKIKSKAGSSVYVKTKDAKAKRKEEEARAQQKASKEKARAAGKATGKDAEVISKGMRAMEDYQHFRRNWIALIVVAIVGVVVSFAAPRVMCEGGALESLAAYRYTTQVVGLVAGYGGLIGAFVLDWRKMRPIRKAQKLMDGTAKESKKERAHRERAEANKAAKKASRKGIFGGKKE